MAESLKSDWLSWSDAYRQETIGRETLNPNALCEYGVKCLDDALVKIGRNELVVIGADTGIGKSELSLGIAQHNALQGKTVGVYYLEGGYEEAIRRMKWRKMAERYYEKYYFSRQNVNFRDWMFNIGFNQSLHEIEKEIYYENFEKLNQNLYFYPTTKDFTVETFISSLLDFQELFTKNLYLDLIVIDHLQYFSLTKTDNEITEITKILREVKHITEYFNTPIILISHLKKRGKDAGLPNHEDFYGSSNIAKISTTAIMLSPSSHGDNWRRNIYPTYFRIVKSRVGIRPYYAFLVNFDGDKKSYEDEYEIYKVNQNGKVSSDPLADIEKPKWARKDNVDVYEQ